MMPDPPPVGPADLPDLPGTDQPVVLLCTDVSEIGPGRVAASEIAADVQARAPGLRLAIVPNLCAGPAALPAALRAVGARRVVAGCRRAVTRREEIIGRLLQAGIRHPGIGIVDLMPGGRPDRHRVTTQSAARIHAAAARVGNADLDPSTGDQPTPAIGRVSRRNLFHPGTIARRPVARWSAGRCPGSEGCGTCASACPHGALHVTGSGVTADPAACTGCGACLTACRAGALTVSGLSVQAFEAAASVLVAEARRPGPGSVHGVAIVCERSSTELPVGADWLPLEVPSLEMASGGWLLQILSAGVGVAIAGCDDDACARHGRELDSLCDALAGEHAHGWRRLNGRFAGWEPADSSRPVRDTAGLALPLRFREPEATAGALSALLSRATGAAIGTPAPAAAPISLPPGTRHGRQWRFEAQSAPLGEITVDSARCSACGNCAHACPTGALTATYRDGPALVLSVDASQCSACGVCISSCPESALSMRRVLDSASLAVGRQTVGEVVAGGRCESCGQPLADGLASGIIGLRLAGSHPGIADRLRHEPRCTDCLLVGSRPVHTDHSSPRP